MDLNARAKSARAVCPAPWARKPSEDSTARITLGRRHQAVASQDENWGKQGFPQGQGSVDFSRAFCARLELSIP